MAAYDQRIATRISRDANARLRLAAAVFSRPLSAVLTDLIIKGLEPADELAARLRDGPEAEVSA
jgi:hypothetical protein